MLGVFGRLLPRASARHSGCCHARSRRLCHYHAAVCEELGAPLAVRALPRRPLRPGEVRVAARAAGVNFADVLMVQGKYQVRPELPFVPGFEVAGTVEEIGPPLPQGEWEEGGGGGGGGGGGDGDGGAGAVAASPPLRVGDPVLALPEQGGFASEVVLSASRCVGVPSFPGKEHLDFDQAAALAVGFGTAHVALAHRARLRPGETVLVTAAAGGVGLGAVQVAKCMGAGKVIACAGGPAKTALARCFGADVALDYHAPGFELRAAVEAATGVAGGGVDVVVEMVGGKVCEEALRLLRWEGRLVVVGFAGGSIPALPANVLLVKNAAALGVFWGEYLARDPATLRGSLETVLDWWRRDDKKTRTLQPHVGERFALTDANEALAALGSGGTSGKVVIDTTSFNFLGGGGGGGGMWVPGS
jgi:NADPH2:quinone reductase